MTQPRNLGAFADNLNTSGQVSLTTGVSGTLPVANGGTGSTSTTFVNLASNVTGTLPTANGGTGLTTVGTNGQLLQSNGTSLQWATVASSSNFKSDFTRYSGYVSLPSSININTQLYGMQSVQLTSTTELVFIYGSNLYAVVWDNSAKSFGTAVLVRTGGGFNSTQDLASVAISSTSVLVCSLPAATTALSTVVLTISGTTVSVGTAVNTTLAVNSQLIVGNVNNNGNVRLMAFGSSYVLSYITTANGYSAFRAITVSGTTPTVGSELLLNSSNGTSGDSFSLAYSSSILVCINYNQNTSILYVNPISISGTTCTLGTKASYTGVNSQPSNCSILSSGRIAFFYGDNVSTEWGVIVSISGTTATLSKVNVGVGSQYLTAQTIGSQVIFGNPGDNTLNVLTDNSGTAVAGTAITFSYKTPSIVGTDGTNVYIQAEGAYLCNASISGNNPVLGTSYPNAFFSGITSENAMFNDILSYYDPYRYSNIENSTAFKTSSNKVAQGLTITDFGSQSQFTPIFTVSYNGSSQIQVQQLPPNGSSEVQVCTRSALNLYSGFSAYVLWFGTTPNKLLISRLELS